MIWINFRRQFFVSIGLFILGLLALPVKKLRIKGKIRYYFAGAVLLFLFATAVNWEENKRAFMEGWQEGRGGACTVCEDE